MFRTYPITSKLFVLALFAVAFSTVAAAAPNCRPVYSRVDLAAQAVPTCGSPIGLCAGGELKGTLKGESEFYGTGFVATENTAATGDVVLTGDNTLHLAGGDLFTKDTIVLGSVAPGYFAEIDTVVGGTGEYAGASGQLTGTGTFFNGVGEAILVGEICWP